MFDFVFVILTYKNYNDLEFFLENNNVENSKVIVVNSFYDQDSKKKIERLSKQYNCDFLNLENKGYSYGNNKGVEYAQEHYQFNFLVISNPDIKIEYFNKDFVLSQDKNVILAPKIMTKRNKHQNPFIINYFYFFRFLYYIAAKKQINFIKFFLYSINGLVRRLFILVITFLKVRKIKIYSCHGSFLIFGKLALEKLSPLFYDEMFLYQEEHFLAKRAKDNEVKIIYVPRDIFIRHYEDGSVDFSNKKLSEYSDDSYIKYFEFFNK